MKWQSSTLGLAGGLFFLLSFVAPDVNGASYFIGDGLWNETSNWYEGEVPHGNYTYVSGSRTADVPVGVIGTADMLQIGLIEGVLSGGDINLAGPGTINVFAGGELNTYSTNIGDISVNSTTGQVQSVAGNLAISGGVFGYQYLMFNKGSFTVTGGQVGGYSTWISYAGGEYGNVTANVSSSDSGSTYWNTGGLHVGSAGGSGNVYISGTNTSVYSQSVAIDRGSVNIRDAVWTVDSNTFRVGGSVEGGTLNIEAGTTVSSYGCIVGEGAGTSGTVNVESGGTWNVSSSNLGIASSGTGVLNIKGGNVTLTDAMVGIGAQAGSNGTATITSGALTSERGIIVGGSGTGTLNVNGGTVVANISGGLEIGTGEGGEGTVNVTAGELKTRYLTVGRNWAVGSAELNISGGIVTTDTNATIGEASPGGTGVANVSGGSWDISGNLVLGYQGTGTLDMDGGAVSASNIYVGQWGTGVLDISAGSINVSGQIIVAKEAGSHGTLNYHGGTLTAAAITVGAGSATVNFNQTGSVSFGYAFDGDLDLNVTESGTTTLTGTNTYTGKTTINTGTLVLESGASIANSREVNLGGADSRGTLDVSAKSAFAILSGQTVSGYGTINLGEGKTLSIYGVLTPGNSAGVTTVIGDVALASTSATLMELAGSGGVAGADFDQLDVSGMLAYGGDLSIQGFGGYLITQSGSYDLFEFAWQMGDFDSVTVGTTALTLTVGGWGVWTGSDGLASYTFSQENGVLDVVAVPEPGAMALGGLGGLALLLLRGRMKRRQGL